MNIERFFKILGITIIGFFITLFLIFVLWIFFGNNENARRSDWGRYPMSWDEALKKTNCPFFIDSGIDNIHGHASLPKGTIFGIKSTSTPKYYVAIDEPTRLFISTFTHMIPYHECFKTTAEAKAAGYEDRGTVSGISAPLKSINQYQ